VKILLSAVNARTSDALLEMQNKDKETPLAISQRLAEQRTDQHYQVIHEYLRGVITEKESKAEKVKEELVQQEELKEERERKKLQKLKASAQAATGQKATRGQQQPPAAEDTKMPAKEAAEKVANALEEGRQEAEPQKEVPSEVPQHETTYPLYNALFG
jgi:hypothetical protein